MIVSGESSSKAGLETLKIWDTDSGRLVHSIAAGQVWSCAIPAGNRYVLTAGHFEVKVFELATGTELRVLKSDIYAIPGFNCTVFPDGRRVASAGTFKLIIWDLESGEVVQKITTDSREGNFTCAVSPDGLTIASAGKDMVVKLWDVSSGALLAVIPGHDAMIRACVFTPDGRYVISSAYDMTTRINDVAAARALSRPTEHSNVVNSCTAFPDGSRFVTTSRDGEVHIWDSQTGELRDTIARQGNSESKCCAISPTDRMVIGYTDYTTRIYDATTRELLHLSEFDDRGVRQCQVSPGGERAWLESIFDKGISEGRTAWAYEPFMIDMSNGRKIYGFEETLAKGDAVGLNDMTSEFTPDGSAILSTNPHGCRLRDAETGGLIRDFVAGTGRGCASLSPDARSLARVGGYRRILIHDVATGELKRETRTESDFSSGGNAVVYTPDGRYLVVTSHDRVGVWTARDLTPVLEHRGSFRSLIPTRDGRWAIAAGLDGVAVLPLHESEPLLRLAVPSITCVALARDRYLCAGSSGGHVYRLEIMGVEVGPAITTLASLYDFERHAFENHPTGQCSWCGRRIAATDAVLAAIDRSDSPCDALPDEAWTNPALRSECTHCRGPLRFNPFLVGRRF
jgi:WD40 repeat protein